MDAVYMKHLQKTQADIDESDRQNSNIVDAVMKMAQDHTPDSLITNMNLFASSPMRKEFYDTTQAQIIRRQIENPNIYKTGPTKYQDGANKGHWTPEEDEQLTRAVKRFHSKNWKKIAECLSGRTDV